MLFLIIIISIIKIYTVIHKNTIVGLYSVKNIVSATPIFVIILHGFIEIL